MKLAMNHLLTIAEHVCNCTHPNLSLIKRLGVLGLVWPSLGPLLPTPLFGLRIGGHAQTVVSPKREDAARLTPLNVSTLGGLSRSLTLPTAYGRVNLRMLGLPCLLFFFNVWALLHLQSHWAEGPLPWGRPFAP